MADDGAALPSRPTDDYFEDAMDQIDLLELAKTYFIFDAGLSRANLIRKIQIEQGHADCYATGKSSCDQMECWWRKDCLPGSSEDSQVDLINHVENGEAHHE